MKTKLVFILFLIVPFWITAQTDTTLYFGSNGVITGSENWKTKKEIEYRSARKIKVKTYRKSEDKEVLLFVENIKAKGDSVYQLKISGEILKAGIVRKYKTLQDGTFWFADYQKNKLKREGNSLSLFPLLMNGEVKEYFENGKMKSLSTYKNNQLLSNQNWQIDGSPYIDNIFYSVDQEPVFAPGMEYLHNHLIETYSKAGFNVDDVAGALKVGFVVMENGFINGVRIEEGIAGSVDALAVKAFETLAGNWQAAKLDGQDVRYYQIFPINFLHKNNSFDYLELRGSVMYWQH